MAHKMDADVPATAAIPIASEATIPRGASLLGSDLRSCFVVSDGCSSISLFCKGSVTNMETIALKESIQNKESGDTSAVSFVSVSPSRDGSSTILLALASGCKLNILAWEADRAEAAERTRSLGTLLSTDPHRWLAACWHPRHTGLLSAISQAEVQVALCTGPVTVPAAVPSSEITTASLQLMPVARLQPPPAVWLTGNAADAIPGPCRSTQCHVAWIEDGQGDITPNGLQQQVYGTNYRGASAVFPSGHTAAGPGTRVYGKSVTLVACWGSDLELISWSVVALWETAAAASGDKGMASVHLGGNGDAGGVSGGAIGGWLESPPVARRTLLLGVPGPLCAVSLGPYGSVLTTTEASLAFSYSSPMLRPCSVQQQPNFDAAGGERADGKGHQQQQDQEQQQRQEQEQKETEVIDLRGTWTMATGKPGAPQMSGIAQDRLLGAAAGPSLLSLFNISAGLKANVDECDIGSSGGGSGGSKGGSRRGTQGDESRFGGGMELQEGRKAPPLPVVPVKDESKAAAAAATVAAAAVTQASLPPATSNPAALWVLWPGRIVFHQPQGCMGPMASRAAVITGPEADSNSNAGKGDFCNLASLQGLSRPDLLCCCGALVLAASSIGTPTIAMFRLEPYGGGLTPLSYLKPTWPPEMINAGRGRLRGLAAVAVPSGGGRNVSTCKTGEGEGTGERLAQFAPVAAAAASMTTSGHLGHEPDVLHPMLVVVAGEIESKPAGGGIFGFSRSGTFVRQRVTQLVASTHPLPEAAAAAAVAVDEAMVVTAAVAAAAATTGDGRPVATRNAAASAPVPSDKTVEADTAAKTSGTRCEDGTVAAPAAPEVTVTEVTAASRTVPITESVASVLEAQFAELLTEFRRHVDQRFDELCDGLKAQADRLSRIEIALAFREQIYVDEEGS